MAQRQSTSRTKSHAKVSPQTRRSTQTASVTRMKSRSRGGAHSRVQTQHAHPSRFRTQGSSRKRRSSCINRGKKRLKKRLRRLPPLFWLICGALLVIGAIQLMSYVGTLSQGGQAQLIASEAQDGYVYDWSHLTKNGQRYSYDDGVYEARWGIDVSSHQGTIDWKKVKTTGVQFAMIRVGYRGYDSGTLLEDEQFQRNAREATAAGIDVGFYLFSQAITEDEIHEESKFVLDRIAGYKTSFPVAYDMEVTTSSDRIGALDRTDRTNLTRLFCEDIAARGYQPMVYGNGKWLSFFIDTTALSSYPVWFADYNTLPARTSGFQMLQYTEQASLDGISGAKVDFNLAFFRKDAK